MVVGLFQHAHTRALQKARLYTHALTAATNPLQTKSVSRRISLVPASASSRAPTVPQKLPLGLFAQALVSKSFKYFLFYKKITHLPNMSYNYMPESKTLRNAEGGIEWNKRSSLMIDSRAHTV